jgi:hypothetical protein
MARAIEALCAELILQAEKNEIVIDKQYAERYLEARQRLTANPQDREAEKIVEHFATLMSPFGIFTLPYEDYERHSPPVEMMTREEFKRSTDEKGHWRP